MALTLGLVTGFVEGATPVAYLGEANQLAVLLGNTGERPLTLSADGTTITATFGGLFAAADLQLATGAGAWTGAWTGETLTLTPPADVVVGTNAAVKVPLGSVTVAGEARSETLTLECDYTTPVLGADSVSALPTLAVHAQPSGDATRQLSLDVQFLPGSDVVYRTDNALLDAELPNTIGFSLSNPAATPLLAPDVAWTPDAPPEFRLWFAFAPDEQHPNWGALTTLERAANMSVAAADASWTVDASQANAGYWLLKPANQAILGTGETASQVFTIANLVTTLQPGVTLLYLQYRNLPGYDDGLITLPLEKREPAPGILSFSAVNPLIAVGDTVTLNWTTFATDSLVLEWRDAAGNLVRKDAELEHLTSWPPPGSKADAITPTMDTTFTLWACDRAGNRVGDDWQETVTLVDAPTVVSFSANLGATGQVGQGGSIVLSWATVNADAVSITVGGAAGHESASVQSGLAAAGQVTVPVTRAANWFQLVPSRNGVAGRASELSVEISPTITGLTATPNAVANDGALHEVTVTWTVDDPSATLVLSSRNAEPATVTGLTSRTWTVKADDLITLTATRLAATGGGEDKTVAYCMVLDQTMLDQLESLKNLGPGLLDNLSVPRMLG